MCISGWNAGWTGNGNFPYGDGNSGDFGGDFDSVGTDKNGLPIGLQLIGDCFQEKKLIRAAYTYEKSRGPFGIGPGAKSRMAEQEGYLHE